MCIRDRKYYTLLERRTVSQGKLTIESRLFVSDTRSTIGTQVPLAALPQYADLQPSFELPIDNICLLYTSCQLLMCRPETTPNLIHDICYREAKEYLERMCNESDL